MSALEAKDGWRFPRATVSAASDRRPTKSAPIELRSPPSPPSFVVPIVLTRSPSVLAVSKRGHARADQPGQPLSPRGPQHRHSIDLAGLLHRCPATRSATAAATSPMAQLSRGSGGRGGAGLGDILRRRSPFGLGPARLAPFNPNSPWVNEESVARMSAPALASPSCPAGRPFSTRFSPISEGFRQVSRGPRISAPVCSLPTLPPNKRGPTQPQARFWGVISRPGRGPPFGTTAGGPPPDGGKQAPVPGPPYGERCALPIFHLAVAARCRMRWCEGCWAPGCGAISAETVANAWEGRAACPSSASHARAKARLPERRAPATYSGHGKLPYAQAAKDRSRRSGRQRRNHPAPAVCHGCT
jgi:hypothetical protein